MSIQIEDNATDVLRKSMLGRGISSEMLAARAGLALSAVRRLRRQRADAETRSRAAGALSLSSEKLQVLDAKFDAAVAGIFPEAVSFPKNCFRQIMFCGNKVLPEMTSNAYVIADDSRGSALVVDCGMNATSLVDFLKKRAFSKIDVCITHCHFDHAGGLGDLRAAFPEIRIWNFNTLFGNDACAESVDFVCGEFSLRAISVPGHTADSVVYLWKNPQNGFPPIAFTGDTLFLGSVGGCLPGDLEKSIFNIKTRLFERLDGQTVVAPGHGLATSLASEIRDNPFF